MSQTTGFLYVATGEVFVEEAILSARAVDEQHPETPICLMTDSETTAPVFDKILLIDDPAYGFEDQILKLNETPFDRTIYLNTDIYADDFVADVFDVLKEFDITLAHSQSREAWPVAEVPEAFPEYNSGVIAYRQTERF